MALGTILSAAGGLANIASGIMQYKSAKKLAAKAEGQMVEQGRALSNLKSQTLADLEGVKTFKADTSGFDKLQQQAQMQTRIAGSAPLAGQVYGEQQIAKGFSDYARQAQMIGGGASNLQASLLAGLGQTQQSMASLEAQYGAQRQAQLAQKQAAEMQVGLTAEQARQQGRGLEYQSELQKQQDIINARQQFGQQELGLMQQNAQRRLEMQKGMADALSKGIVGGFANVLGSTGSSIMANEMQNQRMQSLQGILNASSNNNASIGQLSGGLNLMNSLGLGATMPTGLASYIDPLTGGAIQMPSK